MDSISNARNYFINQGLGSEQADMLVSKGMEAYNQQIQPQNMMTMASGGRIGYGLGSFVKASGIAQPVQGGDTSGSGGGFGMGIMGKLIQQNPQMFRSAQTRDFIDVNQNGIDDRQEAAYGGRIGYQMGGVSTMPMNYGQSLQVPQQMPTNFSSAQSITSNPLLNYGQTPLSMNRGGIARLGYQMGGEAGMDQMGGDGMIQMDQQQALQTIIDILIQNGIPPEQAQQLAQQILQIFIQGGAPAVEAFANQLEQQEQAQAMASGGIAGYGYRQGYGFGSFVKGITGAVKGVVKGVASAVKSVAKSPIGKIALTIAATYALGPAGLGIGQMASATPWIASAINAGLANTLVQGITTGKFNPMQALTAAALGGVSGAMGVPGTSETTAATNTGTNITSDFSKVGLGNPDAGAAIYTDYSTIAPTAAQAQAAGMGVSDLGDVATKGYAVAPQNTSFQLQGAGDGSTINANAITSDYSYPGTLDKIKTSVSNYGTDLMNKAQTGIQNLYQNPLGTIKDLAGSAYETVKDNAVPLAIGAGAGYTLGSPQGKDESDEDFAKRQQDEVNPLITYYGRNLQIKNPYFYQKFGAKNPFETAAQGGIMGYRGGGSMVPPARQIEGGIIELDARKTGGYIPYGKKERHDDVPAMLAKDEFVFTSKAVKAAGGGDAKRGAAKMYAIMKQLEGARA